MKTAFLSYSWANEDSADLIDNLIQSLGIFVKRDKRELGYKDNIKQYMQSIRVCDYAILIISDESLKSQACMNEAIELMKESAFIEKALPILVPGTKIFKPEHQVKYLEYWKESCENLEALLTKIGIAEGMDLAEDLKIRKTIYANIGMLLKTISDRNIPPLDSLKQDNFKIIKKYLGIKDDELIDEILSILAESKNIQDTEIKIDELEKRYPKRYEVFVAKGHLEFKNKKYLKAVHSYTQVVSLYPDFADGWYNLGCMQELNGQIGAAINSYRRAIELGSNHSKVYNNLAGLLSETNVSEAETNYIKATELTSNDDTPFYNLGSFYAVHKDKTNASKYLLKAIDINPSNISARMNLGLLEKENNNYDKAIMWFESIIQIDIYNSPALLKLAQTYEESNLDIAKARMYYEAYLANEKDDAYEHKSYFLFLFKHYRKEENLIKQVLHYANFLDEKQKSKLT